MLRSLGRLFALHPRALSRIIVSGAPAAMNPAVVGAFARRERWGVLKGEACRGF
jgi:hypothetical protein